MGKNSKVKKLTRKILKLYETTDFSTGQIANLVKLNSTTVKKVAKDNNIPPIRYNMKAKSSMYDKDRNERITQLIRDGLSYKDIGNMMGITKQRVYQFAKMNNISRWDESRARKSKFIDDIKSDIENDLTYSEIKNKYNLTENRYMLKDSDINTLFTQMKDVRNDRILSEYKMTPAIKVTYLKDYDIVNPNKIKTVDGVYRISSNLGFKKYPKIGDRCSGGIFEDRKILQYIQRKRDKDNWTFKEISDKLNTLGYKTITGKAFTLATVRLKYHSYKKNKYKRIKGL